MLQRWPWEYRATLHWQQNPYSETSEPAESDCGTAGGLVRSHRGTALRAIAQAQLLPRPEDFFQLKGCCMLRLFLPAMAVVLISAAPMAWADAGGMGMTGMHLSDRSTDSGDVKGLKMPMSAPAAHVEPMREAYTANHAFLVKLVSLPDAIPFEKFFSVSLSVYDGKHTDQKLQEATVDVNAGMRHGRKTGFAHGMHYAPRIETRDGVVTISGLSFHMMGEWTLQVDVQHGAEKDTAYLDLRCCALSE